jgi:hypothetical protein
MRADPMTLDAMCCRAGLNVLEVDVATDTGVYREDNVWVAHVLG